MAIFLAPYEKKHATNPTDTKRKYKRILVDLSDLCARESLTYVDQVDVVTMDHYAAWRFREGWGWIKEAELLVQFFGFRRDREWTSKNPARSLKRPTLRGANDIVPYMPQQIDIIAACDKIG